MPSKKPVHTAKDYEEIGRIVEHVYEYNYSNRWRAFYMSFAKGIAAGFGGVIGATVVVAIVLWILSILHYVPFVNQITDNFRSTVQSTTN